MLVAARNRNLTVSAREVQEEKIAAEEDDESEIILAPSTKQMLASVSTRQISGRMQRVDNRLKVLQLNLKEIPKSNWRYLELVMQYLHQDTLIFMRGDKDDTSFFLKGLPLCPFVDARNKSFFRCRRSPVSGGNCSPRAAARPAQASSSAGS